MWLSTVPALLAFLAIKSLQVIIIHIQNSLPLLPNIFYVFSTNPESECVQFIQNSLCYFTKEIFTSLPIMILPSLFLNENMTIGQLPIRVLLLSPVSHQVVHNRRWNTRGEKLKDLHRTHFLLFYFRLGHLLVLVLGVCWFLLLKFLFHLSSVMCLEAKPKFFLVYDIRVAIYIHAIFSLLVYFT